MKPEQAIASLARLAELRQQEVERQQAEVAGKQRVRERYQRNLDRLDTLYRNVGASGAGLAAAALNSGNYKHSVMQLAHAHRNDLALHDADLAVSRQTLASASRRHESVNQLLERQRQDLKRAQDVQEQKRQDEMAALMWQRRPA
ncbi:flagellar FliJ family protein [Acidovorax sp.]|uniref:flagellar FliJ family protein n=1 Tax=Acidovorax sp. TaxID=1872122 RepID=UPI002ACE9357|nr:flagellar FliJ family protein [Acidovorax sp.]MDZ7862149.1 flagellar FliJ family protein [Acidovorax sp.]